MMKAQEKGSMLLQAMMLIVILSIAGTAALNFLMGRAMVVGKVENTERSNFFAHAAESRVNDCMHEVFDWASCQAKAATCGSITVDGRNIQIQAVSWTNGACEIRITVPD